MNVCILIDRKYKIIDSYSSYKQGIEILVFVYLLFCINHDPEISFLLLGLIYKLALKIVIN